MGRSRLQYQQMRQLARQLDQCISVWVLPASDMRVTGDPLFHAGWQSEKGSL